eukprot:2790122-Amphidinium_carterae.1
MIQAIRLCQWDPDSSKSVLLRAACGVKDHGGVAVAFKFNQETCTVHNEVPPAEVAADEQGEVECDEEVPTELADETDSESCD